MMIQSRTPNRAESGEMMIAFVFSTTIFLLALFYLFQIAFSMAATNIVGTEVSRAALQVDAGTLVLASDKNAAMATEIIASSALLNSTTIRVENTTVAFNTDTTATTATAHTSNVSNISKETEMATVTCDVFYDIPTIIPMPGLSSQSLAHHIDYTQIIRRTIEVM